MSSAMLQPLQEGTDDSNEHEPDGTNLTPAPSGQINSFETFEIIDIDPSTDIAPNNFGSPSINPSIADQSRIFRCGAALCCLLAIQYVDYGTLPGMLNGAAIFYGERTYESKGSLFACSCFGMAVGTIVSGFLFSKQRAKKVLAIGLVVQAICIICIGVFSWLWLACILRFVKGMFQAFLAIYIPLWVDEFLPIGSNNQRWLHTFANVPAISQIIGLFLIRFVVDGKNNSFGEWSLPNLIHGVLLMLGAMALWAGSSRYIDLESTANSRRIDSVWQSDARDQFQYLMETPLFFCVSFALAALNFMTVGIQYWSIDYLVNVLKVETRNDAIMILIAVLALRLAAAFIANVTLFAACMWFLVTAATLMIPVSTALLISTVQSYMNSFCLAVSVLIQLVVGWGLSPIVSGAMMDTKLALGFWITLWWCGIAVIFFIVALVLYQKEVVKMGIVTAADDLSPEEISRMSDFDTLAWRSSEAGCQILTPWLGRGRLSQGARFWHPDLEEVVSGRVSDFGTMLGDTNARFWHWRRERGILAGSRRWVTPMPDFGIGRHPGWLEALDDTNARFWHWCREGGILAGSRLWMTPMPEFGIGVVRDPGWLEAHGFVIGQQQGYRRSVGSFIVLVGDLDSLPNCVPKLARWNYTKRMLSKQGWQNLISWFEGLRQDIRPFPPKGDWHLGLGFFNMPSEMYQSCVRVMS
eukprot:gene455-447_t